MKQKEIVMNKVEVKNKIVDLLKGQKEIERIIIFGSFNRSDSPNDIDIAVVQNSSENYLTLALKYRKLIRNISKEIAVDIFPILERNNNNFFEKEVASGEVIYAR
jgi:predicted nucleotidyltransferase